MEGGWAVRPGGPGVARVAVEGLEQLAGQSERLVAVMVYKSFEVHCGVQEIAM